MGRIDKAWDLALANLPEDLHLVSTTKRGGATIVALLKKSDRSTVWQSKPSGMTEALIGAAGYLIHTYSLGVSGGPEHPAEG